MPINLELIENGHILWFQIAGAWKTEEILPAKEKTRRIFQEAPHTVHALADLSKATINMSLLLASQQVIGGEPLPNTGQIAVVGVSWMLRMVAEPVLRAASRDPISFFDTTDQAKSYLRKYIPKQ